MPDAREGLGANMKNKINILIYVGALLIATGIVILVNTQTTPTPIIKNVDTGSIVTDQQNAIQVINKMRIAKKLNTFNENTILDYSAYLKASDMDRRKYFAHESPEGIDGYEFLLQQHAYEYVGENLARNYYDDTDMVNDWLASPEHRKLLLTPEFKYVGFSRIGKYSVLHLAY